MKKHRAKLSRNHNNSKVIHKSKLNSH